MVGCSRIYQVRFRLSKACLQGMTSLMIFYLWFNIRILCSLLKVNVVLFKEGGLLVDLLFHALYFRMKSPHTIRTLSIFKCFLFLRARGSFKRLLTLFWLRIIGFGLFPLVIPFILRIG